MGFGMAGIGLSARMMVITIPTQKPINQQIFWFRP